MNRVSFGSHAGTIILKIGYGYTVVSDDDPFVKGAEDTAVMASEIMRPGRWLVDDYPFREQRGLALLAVSLTLTSVRYMPKWFPGGSFKRVGERYRSQLENFTQAPHLWMKNQIANLVLVFCTRNADLKFQGTWKSC
jgi:hypothetical protein